MTPVQARGRVEAEPASLGRELGSLGPTRRPLKNIVVSGGFVFLVRGGAV